MAWRDIPGYAKHYQISDNGEVRVLYGEGEGRKEPKLLKHTRNAYTSMAPHVRLLRHDGKYSRVRVVHLMRDVWMEGRQKGRVVSHRDGNSNNNALYNLAYDFQRTVAQKAGMMNRKPVFKVDVFGEVIASYPSIKEAARKEFISRTEIQNICARRRTGSRVVGSEWTFMFAEDYYEKSMRRRKP